MTTSHSSLPSGALVFYDPATGLAAPLPEAYRLTHHYDQVWGGCSGEGRRCLYLQRLGAGVETIPVLLIDSRQEMWLVRKGNPAWKQLGLQGVDVSGEWKEEAVAGYAALVRYDERYSYLIAAAGSAPADIDGLRADALAVAEAIRQRAVPDAPARPAG